MMNQDFDAAAYEAFEQAALDKYDFTTCQRSDGSYYGSSGRCLKGSETTSPSKDSKKSSSKSGTGTKQQPKKGKWDDFNKKSKAEEDKLRKKYANKKPDGGLTEAQVRAGGGRLD